MTMSKVEKAIVEEVTQNLSKTEQDLAVSVITRLQQEVQRLRRQQSEQGMLFEQSRLCVDKRLQRKDDEIERLRSKIREPSWGSTLSTNGTNGTIDHAKRLKIIKDIRSFSGKGLMETVDFVDGCLIEYLQK